jgi:hypothetical protein
MALDLRPHQEEAIQKLSNGKILHGGTGSGKSRTILGYYLEKEAPRDIYIITTAKKRNSMDWEREALLIGLSINPELTRHGKLVVDSWNNVKNYVGVKDAFFVFDEHKAIGSGVWAKSFVKISKSNHWMVLSATPGDTWMDYVPVFVANGFFKNPTQFKDEHLILAPHVKFPLITGYRAEHRLIKMRNQVLVEMPFARHTTPHVNWIDVEYDKDMIRHVTKTRWNPFTDEPCVDMAEVWRVLRRIVNSDPTRLEWVQKLLTCHDRLIVFYNFNYELEILRELATLEGVTYAEYNGMVKQPVPVTARWVYVVQYVAGAEAWNCTSTDAVCFHSLTYSYKNFEQAKGRIDRMDTPFEDLFYYVLVSDSLTDLKVKESLGRKEDFNEAKLLREMGGKIT